MAVIILLKVLFIAITKVTVLDCPARISKPSHPTVAVIFPGVTPLVAVELDA